MRTVFVPLIAFVVLLSGCSGGTSLSPAAARLQDSVDSAWSQTTVLYFNVWDNANLMTDQTTLLMRVARDAKAAVGY